MRRLHFWRPAKDTLFCTQAVIWGTANNGHTYLYSVSGYSLPESVLPTAPHLAGWRWMLRTLALMTVRDTPAKRLIHIGMCVNVVRSDMRPCAELRFLVTLFIHLSNLASSWLFFFLDLILPFFFCLLFFCSVLVHFFCWENVACLLHFVSLVSQLSQEPKNYAEVNRMLSAFKTCLLVYLSDPAPHRHFTQVHVREAHSGEVGKVLHEERLWAGSHRRPHQWPLVIPHHRLKREGVRVGSTPIPLPCHRARPCVMWQMLLSHSN